MNREEFIEKKRLEIQEEVDFLREEKADAYKEAKRLYWEIIEKVSDFKYNIKKEELTNKRLELIGHSGIEIYGVLSEVDRKIHGYSKNHSEALFDSLANSEFKTETQEKENV